MSNVKSIAPLNGPAGLFRGETTELGTEDVADFETTSEERDPRIHVASCNSCGSTRKEDLYKVNGFKLVRCTSCGLVYTEDPMSPEAAERFYDAEYYAGSDDRTESSWYAEGESFRIKEARAELDKLSQIVRLDSLLDVGCGPGFFVREASLRGIDAMGLDMSGVAVRYGRRMGLRLVQGDLLATAAFDGMAFSAITFFSSFEHLYRPRETLERVREFLEPHGVVVIETVNSGSFQAKLFGSKWRLIMPDHNFYYSSDLLDEMLVRSGFEVLGTKHTGFVESVVSQLGIREFVLGRFARSSDNEKQKSSSLKERINDMADRANLGDMMIKYARRR